MGQQGQQRSGGGGGGSGASPAPFLIKTHQMVEEAGTDEVISWNSEGNSFVVWKPVEFARDLLPTHFKHNNFSSFVRQLNTYGFRKAVPDRWEFANEHFRRGEQRLLSEIHRRKATTTTTTPQKASVGRCNDRPPSMSNSKEDDQSSSSTSSTLYPPPPPQTQQISDVSDENDKLRKENQQLSSELTQAKRHCEQLRVFLSKYVDVDKLELVMTTKQQVAEAGVAAVAAAEMQQEIEKEGGGGEEEEEQCLKLFGVWLKDRKKRRRCEEDVAGIGGRTKDVIGFGAPWMEMSSPMQ